VTQFLHFYLIAICSGRHDVEQGNNNNNTNNTNININTNINTNNNNTETIPNAP